MNSRKIKKEFKKMGFDISGNINNITKKELIKLKQKAILPGILINSNYYAFCWKIKPYKVNITEPNKYLWIEKILKFISNRNTIKAQLPYNLKLYKFIENWIIEDRKHLINYKNEIFTDCYPLKVYLDQKNQKILTTFIYNTKIVVPGKNSNLNFNIA